MNTAIQIILGFFLADIFTGSFHWFEDTYLSYCTTIPVLKDIAQDNELHHYFPRSMLAYSYIDHMTVSSPFVIIAFIILYTSYRKFLMKYFYLIVTFLFFVLVSNVIHRFSHMRDCENNEIIKVLQKTGLFCSHEYHSVHHKDSDTRYCVISIYSNIILDSIGFWKILESIIYTVFGIIPEKKLGYDKYKSIQNHMHKKSKEICPDKPSLDDVEELKRILEDFKNCQIPQNA